MTSFSLGSSDDEMIAESRRSYSIRHVCQTLVLSLGLTFWNQVLHCPAEYTQHVSLSVMLVCFLIGLRTIADNALFAPAKKQITIRQRFELCLSIIECFATLYGALEIYIGKGVFEDLASSGSILIIGMVIHNAYHALFG